MNLNYLKEFSIINEKYYIIELNKINPADLTKIKMVLTYKPKTHKDYAKFSKQIINYKLDDKYLYVPRFWGIEHIGKTIEKYNNKSETMDIKMNLGPRDYQLEAIEKIHTELINNKGSTLTVGCGFGKTFCSLYISHLLKAKTLIVVHTTVLLNQWIERIQQFIDNSNIGIIKGDVFDIENKTHVIAMVQTLVSPNRKFTREKFNSFGLTIFDECHHMSSPNFSKAYDTIASKYLLGLTATPKREDEMQDLFLTRIGSIGFYNSGGGNVCGIVKANIINYNSPDYVNKVKWNGSPDLHKMVEQIITNTTRNNLIVNLILDTVKEKNRQILVLSSRIKHLEDLKELLDIKLDKKYKSSFYIGGMTTEDLTEAAKANVLFASYQLVSEGTDIPTLNTLIQCTPKKNVEQVVGRIMRGKSPLNPVIYDIVDNFNVFNNQYKIRKSLYKKNKYEFVDYETSSDVLYLKEIKHKSNKSNKNKAREFNFSIEDLF